MPRQESNQYLQKRADLKAVGNFPESVIAQNSLLLQANWSSWCYSVNLPLTK